MLKIAKVSAIILIYYILFYLQIWGDNHIVLYGSAIITTLSITIYCFKEGHIDFYKVPFGVWNNILLVLYLFFAGTLVVSEFSTVISSLITLLAYSIVSVAICYVSYEEGSIKWLLEALIGLALLCAVYTLLFGITWEGYGKTLSKSNNPHIYAAVMNLGVFSIVYCQLKDEKNSSGIIWTILICVMFFCIIQCGSRKYLIATLFMILIWLYASLRERWTKGNTQKKITTIMLLLCIIFLGIVIYRSIYMGSDSYNRMMNNDDMGNKKRIEFYQKSWEIFIENPILGGGYDQFRYLSGVGGYAHSTYAEAIADFGILGCLLYFLPIIYTSYNIIQNALKKNKEYRNIQLLALCIAELFIGAGQIFFMEFHHFLAWTVLFYCSYNPTNILPIKNTNHKHIYIRE